MTLVRIARNWDFPNLLRQTPETSGIWDNITFTEKEVEQCNYLIILNDVQKKIEVKCPSDNIWIIAQEPPTSTGKKWHRIQPYSSKLFTSDTSKKGDKYIKSHPALPWHVNKTYDELIVSKIPCKNKNLSWITSNKSFYPGHKKRLHFLKRIKEKLEFDLFGRGFHEIEDKWLALAPYKYSLAIENFSNQYYWSEKVADCYLSWTMPIYYGCTNLNKYFPKDSFIQIDINSSSVFEDIQMAVESQLWEKNIDAISHARDLVLNHYQFFPFMASHIKFIERAKGKFSAKNKFLTTIKPRIFFI